MAGVVRGCHAAYYTGSSTMQIQLLYNEALHKGCISGAVRMRSKGFSGAQKQDKSKRFQEDLLCKACSKVVMCCHWHCH